MVCSVLAGAASYIAAAESGKAITNALVAGGMDEDGAEAVGGVSGGAIGGVTASAVASTATIGGAMMFGAELGDAIGMVGGPIGMAVGTVLGMGIGAAVGGIGYLFNHVGHHEDPPPSPQFLATEQAMQEQSNAGVYGTMQVTPTQTYTFGNRQVQSAALHSRPGAVVARTNQLLQQHGIQPSTQPGATIHIP
jgi:hypothetical protein